MFIKNERRDKKIYKMSKRYYFNVIKILVTFYII